MAKTRFRGLRIFFWKLGIFWNFGFAGLEGARMLEEISPNFEKKFGPPRGKADATKEKR